MQIVGLAKKKALRIDFERAWERNPFFWSWCWITTQPPSWPLLVFFLAPWPPPFSPRFAGECGDFTKRGSLATDIYSWSHSGEGKPHHSSLSRMFQSQAEPASTYDLVVLGAGVAGLISCIVGKQLGRKVALIEPHLGNITWYGWASWNGENRTLNLS